MKKVMIAVCDTDGAYGEKLGEWISLEKGERMEGISFSSPEEFLKYQSDQEADIVLLGNGFLKHPEISREILKWKKNHEKAGDGERTEEGSLWIYLYEEDSRGQIPDCARGLFAVKKYQSASGILREVFSCYQSWGNRGQGIFPARKEIIGIYSPGHSIWQTPFALTYAQVLGQREKVLYVNLKECAGFREWFHAEYEKDLLDVMYLCLTNEVNVSDCLSSALYTMDGIAYIPPVEDGECLGEISAEDYVRFLELLEEKSGYEVIFLDFGMMIPGFYKLLDRCSQIYIATEPGELQEGPLRQFRQMTARQEEFGMEEKITYLSLPVVSPGTCPGAGKLQQWLWGTLGDYSRRLAGVQSGAD